MSIIERYIEGITHLCQEHRVDSMSVFGSVLTDKFNDDSDVDFLVSFMPVPVEEYADNYLQLYAGLQTLLGRNIDLVEDKAVRNPIFRNNIERTNVQIYG